VNRKTKLVASLLGSALVSFIMLIGCGGNAETSATTNPSQGGKNNPEGLYTELGSWPMPPQYQGNPFASGGVGWPTWSFVFEGLFQFIGSTNKIYNRIATDVDNSHPNETIVHLRHDVKWSDGYPFTSKDVWAYYTLNSGTELTHYLTGIQTPDDYTVVFKWQDPAPIGEFKNFYLSQDYQATIPYHLTKKWVDEDAAIFAQQKPDSDPSDNGKFPFNFKLSDATNKKMNNIWSDFTKNFSPKYPIGTGAYKVNKVTATDMILEKNPLYYNANKVRFKKVDLKVVQDLNQQYALLGAGKIDRYDGTQPRDILESILSKNQNLVHYQMFDSSCVGFIFNTAHKPFDDEVFRKAVIYALDRQRIREVGNYYGHETDLSGIGMIESQVNQYIKPDVLAKYTKYPHDPDKAAQLLESIGWKKGSDGIWREKDGKSFNFVIASDAGWVPAVNSGEIVAEQLTAFGLPTKYKAVDSGVYWNNVDKGNGSYDMSFDWVDMCWGFVNPFSPMRNAYWTNTWRHAHLPGNNGEASFTAKGFDGQMITPAKLLHQIPYMNNYSDRQHAIEEISYVTNQSAWYVNLFQNVTGTWMNMKNIGGVPWADAVPKYQRNMPVPPSNQSERIAETNVGFAGIQFLVDGTYFPN